MVEAEALKNSLRKALQEYRKERPHLSLRAIAKNSGVNRYFLMKLLDEGDASASLDLSQVLLLAKFITQRDSVREVIEASSREVKEVLKQVFVVDYEQDKSFTGLYEEVNLNDSDYYFVLVLATYSTGTKKEFVQKILGEKGERALADLLAKGVVVENGGRIRLAKGTDFACSFELLKQRIPDYLRYYSPQRISQRRNNMHVVSQGVNNSALMQIYDLHRDFYKSLTKIVSDKQSWGDIPFFSFGCMDTFLEEL